MTSPFATPATGASAGAAPAAATAAPDRAKLKKAAQEFEAVFLRQMIGSMRSASLGDGIYDSDATKQFQDMSDAKTAEVMAGKGTLGIAEMLMRQYGVRQQTAAVPGAAAPAASATQDKAGQ